jgi:hypothetical protein
MTAIWPGQSPRLSRPSSSAGCRRARRGSPRC